MKKPTIYDVAALSGVGRSTVSRVLNNAPRVSKDTRQKVMRAVEALGFKVNLQARVLAGGRAQAIGWVYPTDFDIEPNSFYTAQFEIGALRAATKAGIELNPYPVYEHGVRKDAKIIDIIEQNSLIGLIVPPPFADDVVLLEKLKSVSVPLVLVSPEDEATPWPYVGMDDYAGGRALTEHLLAQGHRRFAYIAGRKGHGAAHKRFLGYCDALSAAGLRPEAMPVHEGQFNFRSGAEAARSLLALNPRPTALVCANDDMAAGALFCAHSLGLKVPDDLALVGFDNAPVAEFLWPPLTTVHQPVSLMGQRAVEILMLQIKGQGVPKSMQTLPHSVIIRGSSVP